MDKILFTILSITLAFHMYSQEYQFETLTDIDASRVKSQGQTGTCWSFATSSFLESEVYRLTGKHIDIAEMYIARNTYDKKSWNYIMRQGKTQFSEGGLAHDVIDAIAQGGIVPQSEYVDIFGNNKVYNHDGLIPKLKSILDSYIKNDTNSNYPDWQSAITPILNETVGEIPVEFQFENSTYTPDSFREYIKIVPSDYISLTSFTHEPNYSRFVLNIPDNFSNGSFYNLPLSEFVSVLNNALKNGYSVALDSDVSEKTFSAKYGVAVLPEYKKDQEKALQEIIEEKNVTAAYRQSEFENYNTTDDHLMHITGIVQDQKGNIYYKVKNSWGGDSTRVGNGGYIYMSVPYFKLKSISILLHKDALSKEMKTKLKL